MADLGNAIGNLGADLGDIFAKEHKRREADRGSISFIDALTRMQVPDPTNPEKTKDVFSKETKAWLEGVKKQKGSELHGSAKAVERMLPYIMQANMREATREPKTQVSVPGLPGTYNLTEAQRLQAEQNAAAAKRAEASGARAERGTQLQEQAAAGTQPVQKRRFDQADAKEQRAILEKQPEYQFMNKHGIPPAKILENPFEDYTLYKSGSKGEKVPEAWNITRDPKGTLVGQGAGPTSRLRTSEYIPPDFVPGKTTPDDVKKFQKQFFYEANSPIYRVTKSPYSQTTEDGAAKTTVKGLQYTTNPEGDTMHVHGQYMPMNEYQSMLARANVMKQSYLNKITYDPNSGETLDAYNKRVAGLNQYMTQLGYDPQQFLK